MHLGCGHVVQGDAQILEGLWRERRDQSRKPSWGKKKKGGGDNREDVNLGPNPDRPAGGLLGEVGEDEGPLLGHQLVLLHPELLQQLPPGDGEDGAEQAPPEDVRGLVAGEAVAALGHVAVTEPPAERGGGEAVRAGAAGPARVSPGGGWPGLPGVIDLVGSHVLGLRPLPELGRGLQLPVVEAEQEHLRELEHGLPLPGGQVTELVLHEVQHTLSGGGRGGKTGEEV